jgi:hypothetical protein
MNRAPWTGGRSIAFRFFFIYFLLFTTPWTWLESIPGISYATGFWYDLVTWVVQTCNRHLLRIKAEVEPVMNGSGDTSFYWAQFYTMLILSLAGCLLWSLLDQKRKHYALGDLFLRNIVRYYIAMVAFLYGTIKLFALQMPFPNLSQLATPLGDFLPMRLSWMFIGYSFPYQFFSGLMETLTGILLLNRRTVSLGVLLGLGVFTNVAMMNLSYDIPVKLYSLQLVASCLFLAFNDWRRLAGFFLWNSPTTPDVSYELVMTHRWQRITRVVLKAAFVLLFLGFPFYESYSRYQSARQEPAEMPIKPGRYDVVTFVRNGDTIPPLVNDSLHWKDIVFDKDGLGSINSTDTLFRQRYRRGYFTYDPDTTASTLILRKLPTDTVPILTMKYVLVSPERLHLWTVIRGDSLYLEITRSQRHFQLTERQFHWISEANR